MGRFALVGAAVTPEALRRGILALLLAPDPDDRFLGWRTHWPEIVRSSSDAYGAVCARWTFAASREDLALAEQLGPPLARLRMEDPAGLRLAFAWALETPPWRLAQRLGVTARTVRARTERVLLHLVQELQLNCNSLKKQGNLVQLGERGGPMPADPPRFSVDMHPAADHPPSAAPAPRLPHGDPGLASPSRVWVSGSWFTNGRRQRPRPRRAPADQG